METLTAGLLLIGVSAISYRYWLKGRRGKSHPRVREGLRMYAERQRQAVS